MGLGSPAPGGLVAFSVWGKAGDSSNMFTCLPTALENLRKSGKLPRPVDKPPEARSNFHLGSDDDALRQDVASFGFVDVLSWHVKCVWGTQGRGCTEYAKAFTGAQPKCRAMMMELSEKARGMVIGEIATIAQSHASQGRPVGCDILIVFARKPSAAS